MALFLRDLKRAIEKGEYNKPNLYIPKMFKRSKEVESIRARVVKILHKLVDEGVLPDNWGAESMPIVAKNLTKAVFEDCLKEEPETVAKVDNFGKIANGIAMRIARSMI